MAVNNTPSQTGERLQSIESLSDWAHAHYVRIENAIENASFDEIQSYYASLHQTTPAAIKNDARFPWHPSYRYGDAKRCCSACAELEMAITVNITSPHSQLAKWFPELSLLGS